MSITETLLLLSAVTIVLLSVAASINSSRARLAEESRDKLLDLLQLYRREVACAVVQLGGLTGEEAEAVSPSPQALAEALEPLVILEVEVDRRVSLAELTWLWTEKPHLQGAE